MLINIILHLVYHGGKSIMKIRSWEILGVVFTIIVGTLLHFTYDWTGQCALVGLFSAVNESTWEHLKLLFVPFFIWTIIEYFAFGENKKNFFPAKTISVIAGMLTIIILFYGYMAIFKRDIMVLDISIFLIGVIVSYILSYFIMKSNSLTSDRSVFLGKLFMVLLVISFIGFTFTPPNYFLFIDPTL